MGVFYKTLVAVWPHAARVCVQSGHLVAFSVLAGVHVCIIKGLLANLLLGQ